MTHVREQVRLAFVADINSIAILTGSVLADQRYPSQDSDTLKEVIVYSAVTDPEQSTTITMSMGAPPTVSRVLPIAINIKAESKLLCEEYVEAIEVAIADSLSLPALTKDYNLVSTQYELSQGELATATAILEYSVIYHTSKNNPSLAK